jgi:hypothetical protein
VNMLTTSVGLVSALVASICDGTFGAAFFGRRPCRFGLERYSPRPRMTLLSNQRNVFEALRGGATVESPLRNEENAAVEEVLYLPGMLDVLLQHSDHVRCFLSC